MAFYFIEAHMALNREYKKVFQSQTSDSMKDLWIVEKNDTTCFSGFFINYQLIATATLRDW